MPAEPVEPESIEKEEIQDIYMELHSPERDEGNEIEIVKEPVEDKIEAPELEAEKVEDEKDFYNIED